MAIVLYNFFIALIKINMTTEIAAYNKKQTIEDKKICDSKTCQALKTWQVFQTDFTTIENFETYQRRLSALCEKTLCALWLKKRNSISTAQVCDATMLNRITIDGYKKIISVVGLYL